MWELYSAAMKGKSPSQNELNLFEPTLRQIVRHDHPLVHMADIFPWHSIENDYSSLYSVRGAPAKPVRLMAGLLILKHIFNGSDEGVVREWAKDPLFQYFCGENLYVEKMPCDPSDVAHFRRRLGRRKVLRLTELSAKFQLKSGIARLNIANNIKPGQDNFSYPLHQGFYYNFLKKLSGFKGKFSRILSGS